MAEQIQFGSKAATRVPPRVTRTVVSDIQLTEPMTAPNSAQAVYWAIPTASGTAFDPSNFVLNNNQLINCIAYAADPQYAIVNVEPSAALWSNNFVVHPTQNAWQGRRAGMAHLVGPVLISAFADKERIFSGAILESLRAILDERNTSRGINSAVIQGASIISRLERADHAVPVFYTTEDGAYVAEFLLEGGRISCVFRERYAHVMSGFGDAFTDDVFGGDGYQIEKIVAHLNHLLNRAAADK